MVMNEYNSNVEYQEYTTEPMVEATCTHYIRIDEMNRVVSGWSDGSHPEIDIDGAIVIGIGSYQFRLNPDGEENPIIQAMDGSFLYKWDGTQVLPRTEEEIEADRAEASANQTPPAPTDQEKLRADVDYVMLMMGLDVDPE